MGRIEIEGDMEKKQVVVCRGLTCGKKTAKLYESLQKREDIQLEEVRCFGQCQKGPNVKIDGKIYNFMDLEKVEWFLKK